MPVAEGKSVQQTVELLTRKLEMLGAEKQGTFCVDCETYHTAASTLGSQGQWELGLWGGWNLFWS